jgi:hypothetical protein
VVTGLLRQNAIGGLKVQKLIGSLLLLAAMASVALALPSAPAPEIDGGSAANAVALLFGAGLMIRGRRKR